MAGLEVHHSLRAGMASVLGGSPEPSKGAPATPGWRRSGLSMYGNLLRQGSGGAAADIGPAATHRGYAPACAMLSQKQLNGYPPGQTS